MPLMRERQICSGTLLQHSIALVLGCGDLVRDVAGLPLAVEPSVQPNLSALDGPPKCIRSSDSERLMGSSRRPSSGCLSESCCGTHQVFPVAADSASNPPDNVDAHVSDEADPPEDCHHCKRRRNSVPEAGKAKVKAAILCKEDGSILSNVSPPLVASAKMAYAYIGLCEVSGTPVWSFVNAGMEHASMAFIETKGKLRVALHKQFPNAYAYASMVDFVRACPKIMGCAREQGAEMGQRSNCLLAGILRCAVHRSYENMATCWAAPFGLVSS